jgi:hypothetical protein
VSGSSRAHSSKGGEEEVSERVSERVSDEGSAVTEGWAPRTPSKTKESTASLGLDPSKSSGCNMQLQDFYKNVSTHVHTYTRILIIVV